MWVSVRVVTAALASLWMLAVAAAQECNTGNPCMVNGMCTVEGFCRGTRLNSGSCELPGGDATCMVHGQCVNGVCRGEPAQAGTSCSAGCGTCEEAFPGSTSLLCKTLPAQAGQPCDAGLGSCFPGVCAQGQNGFCQPTFKSCPDID